MKMWYVPSLWEPPIRVRVLETERRQDGRPIYIRSVTDTGVSIDDYAQKFSKTRPTQYH